MSRSFKHNGHCKCEKSCKIGKRIANKKVRKVNVEDKIPNGNFYKKIYASYNICDYQDRSTWTEYKAWWKQQSKWFSDLRTISYFDYYKSYKMK